MTDPKKLLEGTKLLELANMCDEIAVTQLDVIAKNNPPERTDDFGSDGNRWVSPAAIGLLEDADRALRIADTLRARAPAQENIALREAVEAINGAIEARIARCRQTIGECKPWSAAQGEWSRVRGELLFLQEDIAALQQLEGVLS